jgi:plasmid maintenance system antidote protein VapI
MKDLINISEVEKIERLENEYDFQKAVLFERKLRLMADENPEFIPLRKKLRDLIKDYEARQWSDFDNMPESKFEELEKAETLVDFEQRFIQKRKNAIRKKLKEFDLTQQELGLLLGHQKSYMSELINGVSQFTMKDLIIIHRIFGINLNTLIPTYLQSDTREKVKESIRKLNKPKLKLRKSELV